MVYRSAQPGEIKKKHKRSKVVQLILDVLTLLLVAGATYAVFKLTAVRPENRETNNPEVVNKTLTDDDKEDSQWLRRTIAEWFAGYPRNFRAGIVVYDLDNELVIGEINADEVFDGQVGSEVGARFGLGFGVAGQTTAREMMGIMKAVYQHSGMSEADWAKLKEELLAQPDVEDMDRCQGSCRTRYGLPAGFKVGKVYNENYMRSNGSYYLTYRDSAILEFQTSDGRTRNYVVVLLAQYYADQAEFAKLGAALEETIVAHFQNEPLKN